MSECFCVPDKDGICQYKPVMDKIKKIILNYKTCFYGTCEECNYKIECTENDDCSKLHLDKIAEISKEQENGH